MSYTGAQFGEELKAELAKGYDAVRIARWAYRRFVQHTREIDPALRPEIMKVIAMEEGPEFELTAEELKVLAEALISK